MSKANSEVLRPTRIPLMEITIVKAVTTMPAITIMSIVTVMVKCYLEAKILELLV